MKKILRLLTFTTLTFLVACSGTPNHAYKTPSKTHFSEGVAYSEHAFIVKFYEEDLKDQSVLLIADQTDAKIQFEKNNNDLINLSLKVEKQNNNNIILDVKVNGHKNFYNTYNLDINHSLVLREKENDFNILNFFEKEKNIIEGAILKMPIQKNIEYQSSWYIIIEPLQISKASVNSHKKYKKAILPPIENLSEF